jgi:hypothetical protein
MIITGTVLDQSPAQPGTPCVSKDSMDVQMEYLHMQMPIDGVRGDEVIEGVPVMLTAIGSDGSVIDIGSTTTSGYYGTFGMTWTPPNEGEYEVIASFAGDESYGSSSASTKVTVGSEIKEVDLSSMEDSTSGIEASVDDLEASMNNLTTYVMIILVLVIIALVIAVYSLFKSRD